MRIIASLVTGFIFGIGLVISGMANPAKVQNFLDIAGSWDPSLAFVMGGAILVAMPAFFVAGRMSKPAFAEVFSLPTKQEIDGRLLTGAGIFGIGWGLIGLCPGPALVALTGSLKEIYIFVPALLGGIILAKVVK